MCPLTGVPGFSCACFVPLLSGFLSLNDLSPSTLEEVCVVTGLRPLFFLSFQTCPCSLSAKVRKLADSQHELILTKLPHNFKSSS